MIEPDVPHKLLLRRINGPNLVETKLTLDTLMVSGEKKIFCVLTVLKSHLEVFIAELVPTVSSFHARVERREFENLDSGAFLLEWRLLRKVLRRIHRYTL